jgi:hypothetical protein
VAWPTAVVQSFANDVMVVLLVVGVRWPISHTTVVWLVASVVSCTTGTMRVKTHPFLDDVEGAFGVMFFLKATLSFPTRVLTPVLDLWRLGFSSEVLRLRFCFCESIFSNFLYILYSNL